MCLNDLLKRGQSRPRPRATWGGEWGPWASGTRHDLGRGQGARDKELTCRTTRRGRESVPRDCQAPFITTIRELPGDGLSPADPRDLLVTQTTWPNSHISHSGLHCPETWLRSPIHTNPYRCCSFSNGSEHSSAPKPKGGIFDTHRGGGSMGGKAPCNLYLTRT